MRTRDARLWRPPGEPFGLRRDSPQAEGLVGWWPALASRGTALIRDLSGRGNHLANAGGTWANTADRGWGLSFVAASVQYAEAVAAPIAGFPCTMTAWFRAASLQTAAVFDLSLPTANGEYLTLYVISDGTARAQYAASVETGTTAAVLASCGAYTAGAWHLLVGVFESAASRSVHLFRDGLYATGSNTASKVFPAGVARVRWAASSFSNAAQNPMTGEVGETRLYARALTAAEAAAQWHPRTRWELYRPIRGPRWSSLAVPVAPPPPAPGTLLDRGFPRGVLRGVA